MFLKSLQLEYTIKYYQFHPSTEGKVIWKKTVFMYVCISFGIGSVRFRGKLMNLNRYIEI
jgi:hypothetical protein